MSTRNYSHQTLSDFLDDDSFVRWVIAPDPENDSFWKSFLLQHPDKEDLVTQAASLIRVYRLQESFKHERGKDLLWKRIEATVRERPVHRLVSPATSFYRKIAAVILALITCGAILWLVYGTKHTIATRYGEVKTITLPDGSFVTLNGNSSLKYKRSWNNQCPREVWLEGEAYFNVTHLNSDTSLIQQGHRFIVHSEDVNLEVLGTAFNVEQRRDQTNITLISGKVKVQLREESPRSSAGLIMAPGDHVEYVRKKLVEKKRVEKIKTVTAWMTNEFAFVNPQLKDIVKTLRDDQGYTIEINEELMSLSIEGDISVSSVSELLSTIEATLGLRVKRSDQHIIIMRK